ncbi:outer membrane beta-barrel protein [Deferrisoma sp.]
MDRLGIRAQSRGLLGGLVVGALVAVSLFPSPSMAFSFASLFPEPEDYIYTGNATLAMGVRRLDSADWAPVENHWLYGVEIDTSKNEWLVGWVARFLWSSDEGSTDEGGDADAELFEAAVGVRKVWYDLSKFVSPFAGLGGSFLSVDLSANGKSDDDRALGGWGDAGVYLYPLPNLSLGGFVRYEYVPVRLFGADVNAGGWTFGVTLGVRWYDL